MKWKFSLNLGNREVGEGRGAVSQSVSQSVTQLVGDGGHPSIQAGQLKTASN